MKENKIHWKASVAKQQKTTTTASNLLYFLFTCSYLFVVAVLLLNLFGHQLNRYINVFCSFFSLLFSFQFTMVKGDPVTGCSCCCCHLFLCRNLWCIEVCIHLRACDARVNWITLYYIIIIILCLKFRDTWRGYIYIYTNIKGWGRVK